MAQPLFAERLAERILENDVAVVIRHLHDRPEQTATRIFVFDQVADRSAGDAPRLIGIAQLLPFRIEDQLAVDAGVEKIAGQGEFPARTMFCCTAIAHQIFYERTGELLCMA